MNKAQLHNYLKSRGFKVISTGGNCEAFSQAYDDTGRFEVMIVDSEAASLPFTEHEMSIHLLDRGEYVDEFTGDLVNVMHWYEYIVKELIHEIETDG